MFRKQKSPAPQPGAKAFTFAVPPRFDDGSLSAALVLCAHGHARRRLLTQVLRAED